MTETYPNFYCQWRSPLINLRLIAAVFVLTFSATFASAAVSDLKPSSAAINVSGQVLDEGDKPMPGVNILVKGTTTGTTTDIEGNYNITVENGDAVLVFSFIGYTTQEVQVGSRTVINLSLVPDVSTLTEIVVVGYGTQTRASVTGAISSVGTKEISEIAVPSVQNALQGRVAGVNITSNGSPGSNPIVRIRGIGSITGSSDPLYVVDGFPTNGLQNIDPKDIESVDVLKDAASSAIYGSRAANGVIIVTTKKGSSGANSMSVNVDSYYGTQSPWKLLDLLKRDDYLQYGEELLTNAGATLPYRFSNMNEPIYAGSSQTYAQTETDWQREMFQSAPIYQTQASVAANSEKYKLYASAGMFGQDGIMVGTNFKRYNFRFNSEVKLGKAVTFGQTLTIANSRKRNEQESGGRTLMQHVVHQVPYLPVTDPTKLGGYRSADNNDGSDPENPIRIALMDMNKTGEVKVLGTAYVSVNILPSLTYKFTFGGDFSTSNTIIDQPIYNDGFSGRPQHNLGDNRFQSFSPLFQNQLTFDKRFGEHSVNVTAVSERQDNQWTILNTTAQQSSNSVNSMFGGSNQSISDNKRYETTLLSYLGRLMYSYKDKYLLTASIRRDGFSGFAPGHKWGNFPGVSVGWRLSEEDFMTTVSTISDLKLRASYGELGVNNVGPFDFQSSINYNATYPYNNANVGGAYFNKLPNSALSWETTKMTNVGFDLGLMDDRFTFSAEYYKRKVDDLLLDVPPANSMGYAVSFRGNVGKMENDGFEFTAGYHKHEGDLRLDVTGNLTTVNNIVTDVYTAGLTFPAGSNADFGGTTITQTMVGYPIQGFYGWVVDGIFQNESEIIGADNRPAAAAQNLPLNEDGTVDMGLYNDPANKGKYTRPGDLRFRDLDGNGTIDEADRKVIGNFLPKFTYGLNVAARYKNFDITLFLQGVQGNDVYNGTKVLTQGMLRLFGAEEDVLNAWTPENPNTDIPRAISGDPNQNARTSTRFVEDGSYMRIKNLSIGYSLPKGLLSSFAGGAVKNFRVYASFQNLATFTKYSGYDPEIGARNNNNLIQGIDYGQYPQPRTMFAGVQLGF